jgi:hypothetical protein
MGSALEHGRLNAAANPAANTFLWNARAEPRALRLSGLLLGARWRSNGRMKPRGPGGNLPPVLIYAAALTSGVLSAVALQIHLARAGLSLVPLWQSLFSAGAVNLRATGPWWAMAGISFLVSGLTAAALSRVSFPLRRLRLARWSAGIAIVFLLAHIGHGSASLHPVNAGITAATSLAALLIAGMLALCGAYFTVPR